jgi:4-amino-4-deoxy-L-arabinose transferase-like glycosyltransferase
LPRLITDPRRAWIATLLLLAVPGYQKLAAMVHPDNALSAVTALGIAVWLILRDDSRPPGWRVLGLALCAGLVTLTRPFGILPGAALLVACAVLVVRERRTLDSGTFARVIACAAITGALAMSWPAYQVATLGRLSPVYKDSYIEPYLPHRPDFDRIGYFASFYPIELLEVPSRRLHDRDTEHDRFHNKYGNSFWTLLYSETWGEHWLYFSGRYNVENKLWAKRAILLAALPTIPLLLLGFARGIAAAAASILRWRREPDADKALFLTVFLALGVLMYLYWHLDAGLTPGKNSSVKFIYNAYLYPVGIALCFFAPASRFEMRGWPSYATILYVASLPLVFYLPRWLIS